MRKEFNGSTGTLCLTQSLLCSLVTDTSRVEAKQLTAMRHCMRLQEFCHSHIFEGIMLALQVKKEPGTVAVPKEDADM